MSRRPINFSLFIFIIGLFVLLLLEFVALGMESHYKWDMPIMAGLLIGVYLLKDKIRLHPFHLALFVLFLLLHGLGVYDLYSQTFFGLEFDLYVHGYFGLVSALVLYRTYTLVGPYRGWFVYLAIIAVILGFSAFHELFEYAGALTVGEGEGVLFVGAGDIDEWDTQKDMRNNLVGAIIGLLLYKVYGLSSGTSKVKRKR